MGTRIQGYQHELAVFPGGCGQSGRCSQGKTEWEEGHRRGQVALGETLEIGKADLKGSASGPLGFSVGRTSRRNWMSLISPKR